MRSRSGGELPQLELECLTALWEMGEAPVAAVHEWLSAHGRPLAYTTVLTVCDRLRRKAVVERQRAGRAFVYRACVSREQLRTRAVDRVVANFFRSRGDLQNYLNGERGHRADADAGAGAADPAPALVGDPGPEILD